MSFNTSSFNSQLQTIKANLQKARSEAIEKSSIEMKDIVSDRIFKKGLDVNELPIGTRKGGTDYAEKYAKKRTKKGLQVDYIDYFFSGKLASQLKVIITIQRAAKVAIIGDRAEISTYLEDKRGKTFALTKFEIAMYNRKVRQILKNYKLR